MDSLPPEQRTVTIPNPQNEEMVLTIDIRDLPDLYDKDVAGMREERQAKEALERIPLPWGRQQ